MRPTLLPSRGFSSTPSGYSGSGYPTGQYCNDVDECSNNPSICGAGTCSNTTGWYSCACNAGYVFNGTTCAVSDACLANADDCYDANATCTPSPSNPSGAWTCGCVQGYTGRYVSVPICGTWGCFYWPTWTCSDVNECASSPCDPGLRRLGHYHARVDHTDHLVLVGDASVARLSIGDGSPPPPLPAPEATVAGAWTWSMASWTADGHVQREAERWLPHRSIAQIDVPSGSTFTAPVDPQARPCGRVPQPDTVS